MNFYAPCARALAGALADELRSFSATRVVVGGAGVRFDGPLEVAYRACLWSRVASRVLIELHRCDATDADALYAGLREIDWTEHVNVARTMAVSCTGRTRALHHSGFAAQKAKDAICDSLRDAVGRRPSIDADAPDLRVHLHLHRDRAQVSIDLAGAGLHRRGFRTSAGPAPLRETLAAGLLLLAGWTDEPLVDPMCGAGTLLLEAAMIAGDVAPGLGRAEKRTDDRFGLVGWRGHDDDLWQTLVREAADRRRAGVTAIDGRVFGSDADPHVAELARAAINAAGLRGRIHVSCEPLADFAPPVEGALVATNPPYGRRLESGDAYPALGDWLAARGWRAAILAETDEQLAALGLSGARHALVNGGVDVTLVVGDPVVADPAGAEMLANRLRKNRKRLRKWVRKSEIDCYRLYDRDLPEFAVAIDVYGDRLHIAEYAPPASVDPVLAARRLADAVRVAAEVCEVPADHVATKRRARQRGSEQYTRRAEERDFLTVHEGPAKLWVNLTDYLDTGLFLDHRPIRRMIREAAEGKRFLNLFCYTATASVQAALGGAASTTSVDLSKTYLEWARRNFTLNGLEGELVHADVVTWLAEHDGTYDLILLDPPTFSNSRRTETVFDIERDHAAVIASAASRLAEDGVLYFSTNARSFKLDDLGALRVRDITDKTLDQDFQRPRPPHRCWEIRG